MAIVVRDGRSRWVFRQAEPIVYNAAVQKLVFYVSGERYEFDGVTLNMWAHIELALLKGLNMTIDLDGKEVEVYEYI